MTPTRRDFIKFVVAGAVTSGCPFRFRIERGRYSVGASRLAPLLLTRNNTS